jgi:hypothetical protein
VETSARSFFRFGRPEDLEELKKDVAPEKVIDRIEDHKNQDEEFRKNSRVGR